MGLPETGAISDWCHTSPSKTNFELCEPEKKNSPLIKTLVSRLTYQSQTGNLSSYPFVGKSDMEIIFQIREWFRCRLFIWSGSIFHKHLWNISTPLKSKTNFWRKYFLICWQNIQQQWQTILIKLVQKCRFPVPGVCGWYWPKDRGQWGLWRQIKSDWHSFSQIRHNMWCSVIRRTYIFIS